MGLTPCGLCALYVSPPQTGICRQRTARLQPTEKLACLSVMCLNMLLHAWQLERVTIQHPSECIPFLAKELARLPIQGLLQIRDPTLRPSDADCVLKHPWLLRFQIQSLCLPLTQWIVTPRADATLVDSPSLLDQDSPPLERLPECPSPRCPESQGLGGPAPVQVTVTSGDALVLKCLWVSGSKSWRWQLGHRERKQTRDSRLGPKDALAKWIRKHGHHLSSESLADVRSHLALIDDAPYLASLASQPRRGRSSQSLGTPPSVHTQDHALLRVPCDEVCETLLAIPIERLLAKSLATQRRLPASVSELVISDLCQLWKASESPDHSYLQQRLCRVLIFLAPRLLWPEPVRDAEHKLPPHSRPKLVRARHTLLA